MVKPTRKTAAGKPGKPYPDFPLFPHATGRWAKKIRGKLHYFGPWDSWQAALELYQKQAGDLHAGRKPREESDGVTIRDLVNRFLSSKRHLVDTREITERSWQDYHKACGRVIDVLGKTRLDPGVYLFAWTLRFHCLGAVEHASPARTSSTWPRARPEKDIHTLFPNYRQAAMWELGNSIAARTGNPDEGD